MEQQFTVYQGESGAVYLAGVSNSLVIELTKAQSERLPLYKIKGFSDMDFEGYYNVI